MYSNPLPIFKLGYLVLAMELYVSYIVQILTIYHMWSANIFLHSVGFFILLIIYAEYLSSLIQSSYSFLLLLRVLLVSYLKIIAKINIMEFSLMYSSMSFISGLVVKFNPLRADFCVWCKENVHCHSSACGYPGFPIYLVEETVLSPFCSLGTFVKNYLAIYARA